MLRKNFLLNENDKVSLNRNARKRFEDRRWHSILIFEAAKKKKNEILMIFVNEIFRTFSNLFVSHFDSIDVKNRICKHVDVCIYIYKIYM